MMMTVRLLALVCLTMMHLTAWAQSVPEYYGSVNLNSADAMRTSLHAVIDDHKRFPFESESETDLWDILQLSEEDRDNPDNIITIYRNASYAKQAAVNQTYILDHGWPVNYGFIINGPDNYPYTDAHHIFISDRSYKSARGGYPLNFCADIGCEEKPTDFNNGRGGVGGSRPSDSNWRIRLGGDGIFEVWNGRRGDIARALFYTDIRYEGGTHTVSGAAEPDLVISDNNILIDRSKSGENESRAYFGDRSVLLSWHREDPVDDIERARNETIAAFQGNRNPFIDHPEWIECLYATTCPMFEINAGVSDAWYNPLTAGQGFFITVFPKDKFMFLAMFTYEVDRPDGSVTAVLGEAGHRWLTAYGTYEGNTAFLVVEKTSGGVFNSAIPKMEQDPDGQMTIEFGGCDNAMVSYDIPSIARQGNIPITRVVKDNISLCDALVETSDEAAP